MTSLETTAASVSSVRLSIRYDTIEEINVDSKAEYTA